MKTKALAAALILLGLASGVRAGTITFEGHPDDFAINQFDSGFQFDTIAQGWAIADDGFDIPANYSRNGTVRYFAQGDRNSFTAQVVISPQGGGVFSLNQIDAATARDNFTTGRIEVIGNLFGGGTVSTFFDVTNKYAPFVLPATYTNLLSVVIRDTVGGDWQQGPGFGLDNIVFNGASAVPEPATLASAGLGVLILAGARLRRRRVA